MIHFNCAVLKKRKGKKTDQLNGEPSTSVSKAHGHHTVSGMGQAGVYGVGGER